LYNKIYYTRNLQRIKFKEKNLKLSETGTLKIIEVYLVHHSKGCEVKELVSARHLVEIFLLNHNMSNKNTWQDTVGTPTQVLFLFL
jgi:hypothetical protein